MTRRTAHAPRRRAIAAVAVACSLHAAAALAGVLASPIAAAALGPPTLPDAAGGGRSAARWPATATPVTPIEPRVGERTSELMTVVDLFAADRAALQRRYDAATSPERRRRMRDFYAAWRERLREVNFGKLGLEGRIDYVLLDAKLREEIAQLAREDTIAAQVASLAPFAGLLTALQDARRRLDPVEAPTAGRLLTNVAKQVDSLRKRADSAGAGARRPTSDQPAARDSVARDSVARDSVRGPDTLVVLDSTRMRQIVALRAVQEIEAVRATLGQWYKYYAGYDPVFTWWVAKPQAEADTALKRYVKVLRERVLGMKEGDDEPIIGYPIGAAALRDELEAQFIAYSPEELLAIAEREFAWCEAEMRKAARQMGFADDWRAALEKVKNTYVEPGKQPALIRDLANEAIDFVERRQLLTIPPLAKEVWRMEMMTPEQQKVAPFFLGGEVIRVSYPTDAMTHEDKLMSMRGNNPHFSRATVHHELIPGHHLQQFMNARYNAHRQAFRTPFWTEGWALYWEMRLWDLGFPRTPEDRVGMLFWRSHRAARIIFSLRFHLGTMSPQEAIDLLVERVGHERANATAEVRRSFNGSYPPLYQIAYMMGGLQFRALHQELVASGRMSEREFHDKILQGGNMPIDLVRARLTGKAPSRDHHATWRFAGSLPQRPSS